MAHGHFDFHKTPASAQVSSSWFSCSALWSQRAPREAGSSPAFEDRRAGSESSGGGLTTRWSRPGQPGVDFGAILALAGRAAHLEAVRRQASATGSSAPASLATLKVL